MVVYYEKESSVARNLKNLTDEYEDDNEYGGIQKIDRHPRFKSEKRYKNDNRDVQKKRREKDKMRQAATRRQEYEEE